MARYEVQRDMPDYIRGALNLPILKAEAENKLTREMYKLRRAFERECRAVGLADRYVPGRLNGTYFHQMERLVSGMREQAGTLWKTYLAYKEKRDELILYNLKFAQHIAMKQAKNGETEDLFQEGALALQHAGGMFEHRGENRFLTYAGKGVCRHISKHRNDALIRIPKEARAGDKRFPHAVFFGAARLTDDGIPSEQLFGEEDRSFESSENKEYMRHALKWLSRRERLVIAMRYGLDGGEKCTLGEIGHIVKRSRERVRQIEKIAVAKLRKYAAQNISA